MNGSNGYSPANYGAPPPPAGGFGPPQQGYAPASQPPQYGAPPPQQNAYGAPPSPYGAAPSPYGAAPSPYGQVQYPGQGMQPMGMGTGAAPKNTGLAVALELLGGFFFQTFGVGHLYAGNIGMGLGLMFGYWVLTAINVVLCFAFVGLITWPLTWLGFMILSSITANNAAKRANARAQGLAI
jgi:TM2 domain-containing membrane protein YozV